MKNLVVEAVQQFVKDALRQQSEAQTDEVDSPPEPSTVDCKGWWKSWEVEDKKTTLDEIYLPKTTLLI